MSQASRLLKVGDKVTTDWDREYSGITEHVIVGRTDDPNCQTGIAFQVEPPLRIVGRGAWIDAGWFEPMHIAPVIDDKERTE
jgi:hypothetical protein